MSVENADNGEVPPDRGHQATGSPRRPDRDPRPERTVAESGPPESLAAGLTVAAGLATTAWRTILVLASVSLLLLMVAVIRSWPEPSDLPMPPNPSLPGAEGPREPARLSEEDLERLLRRRVQDCLCTDGRLGVEAPEDALYESVAAAFDPLYTTHIPEFLDWHYSVGGQYTELALAAAGRLEQEIESRLFGNLNDRIEQASDAIATTQETEVRAVIARCIDGEVQLLDDDRELRELRSRMLNETIDDTLRRVRSSFSLSGSGAVGTGVAGGLLVKAVVKKLVASVAVKTTGKTAAKAIGSWKAAAALAAPLSALGPVGTLFGGVLGAVGGWVVVDFLAVQADERWNRSDLEQTLVALIDERRAEVEAVMSAAVETRSRAFDAVCMPRALDEDESEPLGPVAPSDLANRR